VTITIQTLLFARYAELAGTDRVTLELPCGARAGDVVRRLREAEFGASLPESVLLAVNGRQATSERPLHDGDELAILPPLAGG
jgi:molybdopterin converting factor small subunit